MNKGTLSAVSKVVWSRSIAIEQKKKKSAKFAFWSCKNSSIAIKHDIGANTKTVTYRKDYTKP